MTKAAQTIRIWHPMFDPYHCGFRMLRLLSVRSILEIEVLFLLDFYLLFPFLLHAASMPEAVRSKFRELKIEKHQDQFVQVPSPQSLYRDLSVIQKTSLVGLAARGLTNPEALQKGTAQLNPGSIPEKLAQRIDLQIQQRESQQLQQERIADLEKAKSRLKALRRDHQSKTATYDALSRAPISSRDAKIGQISRRIGFIERSVVNLQEKIEMASKHDALVVERDELNSKIGLLDDEIKAIIARQDRRKREAYTQIATATLDFLRRDTGNQEDFLNPKLLEFSFGDDAVFVDGKSNFAASSLVILKNSFHLAMMFASMNDNRFLLPRFMMFDNIEDKGMRPDRSHNFQSLILNVSAAAKTKHQIIFTTSMLDPELRSSPQLVGPEYSKEKKTLNIL